MVDRDGWVFGVIVMTKGLHARFQRVRWGYWTDLRLSSAASEVAEC